jgi:hypothetical protein
MIFLPYATAGSEPESSFSEADTMTKWSGRFLDPVLQ